MDAKNRGDILNFPNVRERNPPRQPGSEAATDDAADQASRRQQALDDTMMKIDKLVVEQGPEVEDPNASERDYADTATGRSLAELIDEMDARHADLDRGLDAPVAPGMVTEETASPTAEQSRALKPMDLADTADAAEMVGDSEADSLLSLMEDFEHRIQHYVDQAVATATAQMRLKHAADIERIREIAALQVRKREAAIRAAYRKQYKDKELVLRNHYKKLIALASKIGKQRGTPPQA
ncbi:MAG: hypothetical protein H6978_05570 [Gammaproteobacteria bacterium]|nr:hypothetical protein [Gammaproteobacteria bacterium]